MSKKRKTRKQKERTALHLTEHKEHAHMPVAAPSYSIDIPKVSTIIPESKTLDKTSLQKDVEYLKHDISGIVAASGIILAFDILLFVLLTSGTLKLNFLGY